MLLLLKTIIGLYKYMDRKRESSRETQRAIKRQTDAERHTQIENDRETNTCRKTVRD